MRASKFILRYLLLVPRLLRHFNSGVTFRAIVAPSGVVSVSVFVICQDSDFGTRDINWGRKRNDTTEYSLAHICRVMTNELREE
jgi:hypothetical protein